MEILCEAATRKRNLLYKEKGSYLYWVRSSKLLNSAGNLCLGFSRLWLGAVVSRNSENQFGSLTLETELNE